MCANAVDVAKAGPGPSISVPAISDLSGRELIYALLLLSGTVSGALIFFVLDPSSAAVMVEYVFKFLPAMADNPVSVISDGHLLGDPRLRVVPNLAMLLNIEIRQAFLQLGTMHPALGLNWLLYPLTAVVFFLANLRMFGLRVSVMATVLFLSAPAALDMLVNYYIPAKPLSLFSTVTAFLGVSYFPIPYAATRSDRPILGSFIIVSASLIGIFSDETAIFIFLCLPIMAAPLLISMQARWKTKVLFCLSFLIPGLAFILSAVLFPYVNNAFGQIPVNIFSLVRDGVYTTMMDYPANSLHVDLSNYSPFNLLDTIISAHGVPFRDVPGTWTGAGPWRFWQWQGRHERIAYYIFLVIVAGAFYLTTRPKRKTFLFLFSAFMLFVFVEALLIFPLSPYLLEVNYYAGHSSFFVPIMVAFLLGNTPPEVLYRQTSWALLALMAIVQFSNFYSTAQRHPHLFGTKLTWAELASVRSSVLNADGDSVLSNYDFPGRLFSYGFEVAVARAKRRGRSVDFIPLDDSPASLAAFIDVNKIRDPAIPPLFSDVPETVDDLRALGAKPAVGAPIDVLTKFSPLRGQIGNWGVSWHLRDNVLRQDAWRFGLMRVWRDQVPVSSEPDGMCGKFPHGRMCIQEFFVDNDNRFYAIGKDATVLGVFYSVNEEGP